MIEAKGHGRGSPEIFRLVKTLGHGGFADTYLAEVLSPQLAHAWGTETVAIKIPKDRRKEKTLIQELQTNNLVTEVLRDLAGATNVVRYLGFEDYDGKWVMVMEYVAGGSARDVVGHLGCQKPMDIDRAVGIVRGVLQGLSAIHRAGVFHRDIKPENILLDNQGVPKVADLGIATMLHSNEQASSTVGTLAYMSPEILGPDGASFESDIWSVGVTLYEMLTGRWPFGDETTPMGSMV
ncbi:MAG: serine/threonine-protein kinase, partial [Dehalococcoidia bacterium]